jgi:PhnB protein
MSVSWKPEGYNSVSPYLIARDVPGVVDFLVAAFDAEELRRFEHEDSSVMHAEVRVDDTVIMLGGAGEGWPAVAGHVHVYVPDVDATYERALASGGDSVQEPTGPHDDPDRRGGVKGPGGNTWWIGTTME